MRKFLLAAVFLIAACTSKPAPELYALTAEAPAVAPCRATTGIVVQEPIPAPGLDSTRIAVIDRPNHQTFYKDVRWNAPASVVVQHYLAESFERSGMFKEVLTDDTGADVPLMLESQLRAFAVDQSYGAPRVQDCTGPGSILPQMKWR